MAEGYNVLSCNEVVTRDAAGGSNSVLVDTDLATIVSESVDSAPVCIEGSDVETHSVGVLPREQYGEGLIVEAGGPNEEVHVRDMPVFNAFELRQRVDFRDINFENLEAVPGLVRARLTGLIDRALCDAPAGSVLNAVLRGPSLASDVQTVLSGDSDYNTDRFLEEIGQVLQSNAESLANNELELIVTLARSMSGGARLKLGHISYDEILSKKGRFLYNPNNSEDNNLCFSLCLAHFINSDLSEHDKLAYAKELQSCVGLDYMHKVAFSDISKFEKHLDVKIVVFYHQGAGRKRLQQFTTHDAPHHKTIWLYLHNDHYYMVENKTAFFGGKYVCEYCYKTYEKPLYHYCKHRCNVCLTTECLKHSKNTRKCHDCNRICRSKFCFDRHLLPDNKHKLIPCLSLSYCDTCGRTYSGNPERHVCATPRCPHCGEKKGEDALHECFIMPLSEKEEITTDYIFYDFETRYHNGKHEANFVCAMDMEGNKFCFQTSYCVSEFVATFRQNKYRGYTFIAHNASGFDNYILLEYFVKQGIAPQVIMRGSRVILMYDTSFAQRWIDSFSFLPMSLAKTPAAMGFDDKEKGYFPHKFNTRENADYVGSYPDPSYYGYESMCNSVREIFMKWYVTVREKPFHFQAELRKYCINDVDVLRQACLIYRKTFFRCTGLDPFTFTTLASSCMGVFKTRFLRAGDVALTYDGAYTKQNKTYSDVSMQWLEYVAHTENIEIKHALNYGEQPVGPYFVDGYHAPSDTCYEFAGCFYHGCDKCYEPGERNPVAGYSHGQLHQRFCQKIAALKKSHTVVVMWECVWTELKKSDCAVQAFMAGYKKPERLDPRKALFGGRTNAMKLYHKAEDGEKIRYYDFTSLYPTVQAKNPYPLGHPVVIHRDFEPLDNYFGLVKCTVLPPRGLFHPVLPYRCHNKLMFPLCCKCAEDLNQTSECTHGDGDRQLSGVWVSFELQKAVEKGYQILSIDEVWHFPNKTDKLFKEYVKTFLKCKQEASGYPGHVKTPEEQKKYIDDYYKKEGIKLDPSKIRVNKAVRSCNKLLLNSLWGRFSMRCNMPVCELITDPERFAQLMFSERYDVRQFCFISDDVAMVQWRGVNAGCSRTPDVNVFIGAMTTAHARMMLYDLLDSLQERVLYCDTDSVVFTSKDGEWVPPLGPYLGDLTDEINDGDLCGLPEEDFITEFVSGGPKCYAYRTRDGKTQVKCKGVTLNATNAEVVTPDSLAGLVHAFVANQNSGAHITTVSDTIKRDKKHFHLKNDTLYKKVQVVYNKRRVLPDYTTLPYGY